MKAHFEMMAAYNAWANRRLYDAALALPEEAYRSDGMAFFKSVHGTLNHIFVADVIWMSRFRGIPNPPWPLDHIAHDDREALRKRREAMDKEILGFVGSLTEERLVSAFSYMTVSRSEKITQDLGTALAHFFNHQTHHRGQCHALLTAIVGRAPALDLLFYQREIAA